MDKKTMIKRIIAIVILISISAVSIFAVTPKVSTPKFFEKSNKILEDKKMQIAALTAAAATVSTAISAVPGDATTPIANEIMDTASYLLIITAVILLEKILLTLTGLIAFKFIIPISCCLGIIYIVSRKCLAKEWAIKLGVYGVVIFMMVPLSVYISSWIENNYKDTINIPIETAEEIENVENDESQEEEQKEERFLKGILSKAQDVTESITSGVDEGIKFAKQKLSELIDAIAVYIITTCVIPILVIVFFIWITKMILGVTINIPTNSLKRNKKDKIETSKEIVEKNIEN